MTTKKISPPMMRPAPVASHKAAPAPALLTVVSLLLVLLTLAACADTDLATSPETPLYRVEVSQETFVVAVTDPAQVVALDQRLASGEEGVVSGELLPGAGGFNSPWSWHMDPTTVHVADVAIEVCDGRPSMVEADLTYWIQTVGQFCPWGAAVVERIR